MALRVGTAGFAYKDWEGVVYPDPQPTGFDRLAFLASYFDCIEMNTTFYGVPKPATVARWVETVDDRPGFRFTFKLYRGLTHGDETSSLAPFLEALGPCRDAGKLGAILMQFGHWFKNTQPNRARLAQLARGLEGWPCAIEIRDRSWLAPPALDFLGRLGLGLCDIDICQAKDSVPPSALTTTKLGYVRLHGRNADAWFDKQAGRDQKYDYHYPAAELDEWVKLIREIATTTESTYVITNNHFGGQAVANAFTLARHLGVGDKPAPAHLAEKFEELR
ncbi:MAG: DUF72 domain-containing protein [Planctomycetota bacterium]|jgi:uncharacterized protein YecE (DUF72 family)